MAIPSYELVRPDSSFVSWLNVSRNGIFTNEICISSLRLESLGIVRERHCNSIVHLRENVLSSLANCVLELGHQKIDRLRNSLRLCLLQS